MQQVELILLSSYSEQRSTLFVHIFHDLKKAKTL